MSRLGASVGSAIGLTIGAYLGYGAVDLVEWNRHGLYGRTSSNAQINAEVGVLFGAFVGAIAGAAIGSGPKKEEIKVVGVSAPPMSHPRFP